MRTPNNLVLHLFQAKSVIFVMDGFKLRIRTIAVLTASGDTRQLLVYTLVVVQLIIQNCAQRLVLSMLL
jgi:hypothetical protein